MEALSGGHKPQIAHAALTFVYYWYNFMPLARGTAVAGYITLLAVFLAADMPITSFIPKVSTSNAFDLMPGITDDQYSSGQHSCVQALQVFSVAGSR